MRPLDVGVIGCGTAGSAAALFLARAGHRVTIYERVASPGPVGAGITLQPTGLHVLCKLGLYEYVVSRGSRLDRLLCESSKGKTLVDLKYKVVDDALFGLGTHRGVLFEALHTSAQHERNITIKTGVEMVDLAPAPSHGRTRLTYIVDADRDRHGPHELIVVADGARSQLRDDTSTSKRIAPYPWGALWFVAKDTRENLEERGRTLHQVVNGVSRFVGMLPTGNPAGKKLVSLFWSIRADRVAEWRTRGLDEWKKEVLSMTKEAEPLLDQIEDEQQLLFAAYHDVVMHRWHTRNVVYLGDAAHATSPQLGQGCNLALWDAMELSDALGAERNDLHAALSDYSKRRRDHLAFYQVATRWLTPFFQSDVEAFGTLRDFAMPLMNGFGFFEKMMTLTMLGVMKGFAGDTLTLMLPKRPPAAT